MIGGCENSYASTRANRLSTRCFPPDRRAKPGSMRIAGIIPLLGLACALSAFAQEDAVSFKSEVRGAFVWGEDAPGGAISWTVQDPLTGISIRKLKHSGVEVSSRMGFEKLHSEQVQELVAYTSTIVNNTDTPLSVEYGGIAIDGHTVPPLSIAPTSKSFERKRVKSNANMVESGKLYCFVSGFLSEEHFLTADDPSSRMIVDPRSSVTVSTVIRDPRHYPILCTSEGCLPKGTVRHVIRVGGHDYVFIWPGRLIVNCGK